MKLKHYCTIIILLIVFVLPIKVFSQSNQEQLLGTWVFDYDASFAKMDSISKAHYNRMDANRKTQMEKAYKGRAMTFGNDGSYVQQSIDGHKIVASWVLSDNSKDIVVTNPEGKELRLKIKKIGANFLVLNPVETNTVGKAMISELHFTKH